MALSAQRIPLQGEVSLEDTERLVRRMAALAAFIGVLAAFAVAAALLGMPFLGLWAIIAPAVASITVAIVLRGARPFAWVWKAAAAFYVPTLIACFSVLALLLTRGD